MFKNFSLRTLLLAGLMTNPAFAEHRQTTQQIPNEVDAYCELRALESESNAAMLAIPKFVGSASVSPENTFRDKVEDTNRIRVRLGLEYSLRNIRKAELVRQFADADCERYRLYRSSLQHLENQELRQEQTALIAQQKVLVQYLIQFEQSMLSTEKKFYAHSATVKQLDAWQLAVLRLQQNITELESRLDEVTELLQQNLDKKIELTYSEFTEQQIWQQNINQQIRTQQLKRQIDTSQNWDLKVAAGYEYRNVETPVNVPGYVELTFKYNLGQFLSQKQKIQNANSVWLQLDPQGYLQSASQKQQIKQNQREISDRKFGLIKTRLSQLSRQQKLLNHAEYNDEDNFFLRVLLEKAQLESEAAYLSVLLNQPAEIQESPQDESGELQMAEFSNFYVSNKMPPHRNSQEMEKAINSGRAIVTGKEFDTQALRVTSGQVYYDSDLQMYTTTSPSMRVHSDNAGTNVAELTFQYLGTSSDQAKLSGGEYRQQVGMFLKTQNQCNCLYIMWRFNAYGSRIVVQTKRNPDMTKHKECGARGYETIRPEFFTHTPAIAVNQEHKLHARLSDQKLEVFTDDKLVWMGNVDMTGLPENGYAGVRSDNTNMRFKFKEWNLQ